MADVRWTEDQQKVITLRNRNILVSAAAGSGKTAVLVERIITMISEEDSKIDIDRLLIVTFTRAAAAEMKERISAAIERKLNELPENLHLQKQMTLIHSAQITTIHSFCKSVIKNNFNAINIDPAFRIGDDTELKLMKADVIEELLEEKYEEADQAFLDFIESYSTAKSDENIEKLILQLYEFSMSYPWPEEWLRERRQAFDIRNLEEMQSTDWMKSILDYIGNIIREMVRLSEEAAELCKDADGPHPYLDAINNDIVMLRELAEVDSYSGYENAFSDIKWTTLSRKKDPDASEEKKAQVKAMRDDVKKTIGDIGKSYFFQAKEEMLLDIMGVRSDMNVLIDLTIAFMKKFAESKEDRNIVDYNDLEHFALNILVHKEGAEAKATDAAVVLSNFYEEILIDEYQDSNLVQETILNSISKEKFGKRNLFMVGDVKQSIYKFRLARPELFMDKFHKYSLEDSDCQRIDLHKNFRSRPIVLDSINYIFEQIMTKELGDIEYNHEAALYAGADFPEAQGSVSVRSELLLIDDSEGEDVEEKELKEYTSRELEARAIALKIKELMDPVTGIMVYDKGEYRKAEYGDIVILLRTMSGWSEVFTDILMAEGVPASSDTQTGYFSALEIKTVLNMLRIIDNPRQDIPLTAVLYSPIVDLTSSELAEIKSQHKELEIYDAVVSYRGDDEAIDEKLELFLEQLELFRKSAEYLPIHQLIQLILKETGYSHYVSAMPAGERRAANLDMLVQMAIHFEQTSYHGLFQFNRYIDKLHKYEVDYGEAGALSENENNVRIMSIHKSKGLEFPIVFVSGLGKNFNTQDARSKLILHPDLGIGPDFVDYKLRLKSPTLIKKAMQRRLVLENLGEELRILYVALTRAKEKLILTGYSAKLPDKLVKWSGIRNQRSRKLPFHRLSSAGSFLDFVVPSLMRHPSMSELMEQYGILSGGCEHKDTDSDFRITSVSARELIQEELIQEIEKEIYKEELLNQEEQVFDEDIKQFIEGYFGYEYPFEQEVNIHAKVSVSELKRLEQREEDELAEQLYDRETAVHEEQLENENSEKEKAPRHIPRFMSGETALQGSDRGSLYHRALEHLKLSSIQTIADVKEELFKLVEKKIIDDTELSYLSPSKLYRFAISPIAKRMLQAEESNRLYKERQFVMGIPANEINEAFESSEIVLIQGIIDVYFIEDNEIVLVDYKTDRISEGEQHLLTERYKVQLDYYEKALEKITRRKVKERVIYSFSLEREIMIP